MTCDETNSSLYSDVLQCIFNCMCGARSNVSNRCGQPAEYPDNHSRFAICGCRAGRQVACSCVALDGNAQKETPGDPGRKVTQGKRFESQ
jgi:hypothetical protein